jgi:hypothetical protein
MSRTKIIMLLLAVVALVAVGHHQLTQMSRQALNTQLVPAAEAATLQASSGAGDACSGTGTWHFVNPQNGGDCEPLTVLFSCGTVTASDFKCLNHNTNYSNIQTSGSCTLLTAFNSSPGKVVLSDFSCVAATPTPTPTGTPTPTPTP